MKMNNYQSIIMNYNVCNYKHLNKLILSNNKLINYINNKLMTFKIWLIKSLFIIT